MQPISASPNRKHIQGCHLDIIEIAINMIRTTIWKITNGEAPPPTHIPTLFLSIAGIFTGVFLAVFSVLDFPDEAMKNNFRIPPSFGFAAGLIMLLPSLRISWMMACCWKRVRGYDWWMIPTI